MRPAIFLDRDGVIIENRQDYVQTWADVVVFPQALAALADCAGLDYLIVIVTNQSAIGRGIMASQTVDEINCRLLGVIREAGGRVDAVYVCPHAPEEECACRKPRPGLLLRAASELQIDMKQSILVGDSLTDLMSAQAAGLRRAGLVRTGRGLVQEQLVEAYELGSFPVYDTLAEALASLLEPTS